MPVCYNGWDGKRGIMHEQTTSASFGNRRDGPVIPVLLCHKRDGALSIFAGWKADKWRAGICKACTDGLVHHQTEPFGDLLGYGEPYVPE